VVDYENKGARRRGGRACAAFAMIKTSPPPRDAKGGNRSIGPARVLPLRSRRTPSPHDDYHPPTLTVNSLPRPVEYLRNNGDNVITTFIRFADMYLSDVAVHLTTHSSSLDARVRQTNVGQIDFARWKSRNTLDRPYQAPPIFSSRPQARRYPPRPSGRRFGNFRDDGFFVSFTSLSCCHWNRVDDRNARVFVHAGRDTILIEAVFRLKVDLTGRAYSSFFHTLRRGRPKRRRCRSRARSTLYRETARPRTTFVRPLARTLYRSGSYSIEFSVRLFRPCSHN